MGEKSTVITLHHTPMEFIYKSIKKSYENPTIDNLYETFVGKRPKQILKNEVYPSFISYEVTQSGMTYTVEYSLKKTDENIQITIRYKWGFGSSLLAGGTIGMSIGTAMVAEAEKFLLVDEAFKEAAGIHQHFVKP